MIKEIVSSSDIGIITIGRISGEGADRAVKGDFLISDIEKNMIFQVCEAYHKENKKVKVMSPITKDNAYKDPRFLIFSLKSSGHGEINDGSSSWD